MMKIPTLEYLNKCMNGVISQTPKKIHTIDSYKGNSIAFTCASIVPVGDINLPKFTTGVIIEQREGWADAVMIAIDYENNLYLGYRNGDTWSGRSL